MSSGHDDKPTVQVGDVEGNVVQGNRIDQVTVHGRDRRTVVLLALTLVVVLAAAAVIVWLVREPDEQPVGDPLAASVSFGSTRCGTGNVVPDQNQSTIPHTNAPGGVAATGGEVVATLQGLSRASVVLQSMRVQVVRRKPAVPGLYLPNRCASDVPSRYFAVDLSADPPAVKPTQGQENGQQVAANDFPFKIDPTDVEQLVVRVNSPAEEVEFRLLVRWTSGTSTGEFQLDDKGKPFRITATTAAEQWCDYEAQNVWKPC
ncbi:hypothetical protein BBK82_44170 [Lentzea guizhouensis]|uniref:Uncharacterized protein n=1 Tax=Lentzea guizhouensis TaxID=1586287 RepID=A0A1B2HVX6_9PSEU|nr:hypothetical protein [Lentzea guizhouensis]ANZ41900.1 hypothetical protein BBK82_44170 [Lentzea guizhouensis]